MDSKNTYYVIYRNKYGITALHAEECLSKEQAYKFVIDNAGIYEIMDIAVAIEEE